eukprot:Protomagalhaensia_sp_Gyna_25__1435@NODE_1725_length_1586_cov_14_848093_g1414_i0_p2_GENE_NODE_1725_length_1586_cov_14_848093_g1414_i0NODE_1725_length_1586_cov_14_848093_g1414_i0_p2_ORF_typecomplete_len141_score13_93_NODE_1725_length_1586_cov_14_848093_g1414_i0172594
MLQGSEVFPSLLIKGEQTYLVKRIEALNCQPSKARKHKKVKTGNITFINALKEDRPIYFLMNLPEIAIDFLGTHLHYCTLNIVCVVDAFVGVAQMRLERRSDFRNVHSIVYCFSTLGKPDIEVRTPPLGLLPSTSRVGSN